MKTIVLDDDPTGTQSATGVTVLLDTSAEAIAEALTDHDSVYLQTNSRALDTQTAVTLMQRIQTESLAAGQLLNQPLRFVLRGDSTLRGHVFEETDVFAQPDDVIVFMPAFPAGGRVTREGIHFVSVDGVEVPAHLTEYADDPVFPFSTSVLIDYVREKSRHHATAVTLAEIRNSQDFLENIFRSAPAGEVLVIDAENQDDIERVARAIDATEGTRRIIVRSASPLAAELAGVSSRRLLRQPLRAAAAPTLVVCGSHTRGATAQLAAVAAIWGDPVEIDTELALVSPQIAGEEAAQRAINFLESRGLAVVTTARVRRSDHNTLEHGDLVMTALIHAVKKLISKVDVVVAKGGITSAEVAREGIGARKAHVEGQVLPGVSVWVLHSAEGQEIQYVVVPGNVGGPSTITDVLRAVRRR